jgi:hypothetical protein
MLTITRWIFARGLTGLTLFLPDTRIKTGKLAILLPLFALNKRNSVASMIAAKEHNCLAHFRSMFRRKHHAFARQKLDGHLANKHPRPNRRVPQ